VEQLAGVHTHVPFWHSVPAGQLIHAAPPAPQNSFASPDRHVVPSQHPFGQLAVVHTQVPFWHWVPGGQLTHATPAVPQNWFVSPVLQL
jgi:hypothetical protein